MKVSATLFALLLMMCLQTALMQQQQRATSDTYTAAVVEFPPAQHSDGAKTLLENAQSYVRLIGEAAQKKADIIVFPEDGLTSLFFPANRTKMLNWTTVVPAANESYVPCTGNRDGVSQTLKMISCAARDKKIYVVINIAEKVVSCRGDKCSPDSTWFHNTNVVFDRNGMIIARYRKVNLYGERQFNVTAIPEVVTFTTDFNVTFGTFICFDILFAVPALNLTQGPTKVRNIVFSTAWFSELPFLTADQAQAGWAFSQNVNLLASGYNHLSTGTAGSGIYMGRNGIAEATMPLAKPTEKLIVATIPKVPMEVAPPAKPPSANPSVEAGVMSVHQQALLLDQEGLERYTTMPLTKNGEQNLCHGKFCCNFTIQQTNPDPVARYRYVVYDGTRFYGTVTEAGVQICAIVLCANDTLASCGSVVPSQTSFGTLKIDATYDDLEKTLVFPSTLRSSDVLPLMPPPVYTEHRHNDYIHVSLELQVTPVRNLSTFALYARKFNRDRPYTGSASLAALPSLMALLVVALGVSYWRD